MSSSQSQLSSHAMLKRAIPLLASLDIDRTLIFHADKLGFDVETFHVDGVQTHFWRCDDRHIVENTSCRIEVEGIDTLYEELLPQGVVHPNGPLEDKPWNFREFAVLDCD